MREESLVDEPLRTTPLSSLEYGGVVSISTPSIFSKKKNDAARGSVIPSAFFVPATSSIRRKSQLRGLNLTNTKSSGIYLRNYVRFDVLKSPYDSRD